MRSSSTIARARALAGACVLALALAACGSDSEESTTAPAGAAPSGGTAASTAKLTFGVTNPDLPGSAYYAAVPTYLKYWSDQGLDVDFNVFNGSGEVMTAVATGKTDIGSGGTKGTMSAIQNGNADLKIFYSYIPNTPYWPVVVPDSPVKSLQDLVGKTVGTFSLSSDAAGVLKGVMKAEGLDPNSVNFVAVGTGAEAYETLRRGRIAAYAGYDSAYGEIESLGFPLRKIDSPMDDYGFMGGIAAPQQMLSERREDLVKFGKGLAQATVFTKANPECALKIQWQVYPESKPAGGAEADAVAKGVDSIMSRLKNQFPVDDQWGRVADKTVEDRISIAVQSGELKESIPLNEVWDPSLLDDMNDFDKAAVEKSAKDCSMVTG